MIIPKIEALKSHHYSASTLSPGWKTICVGSIRGKCWLRDLIEPSTKVSFVNTDILLPSSREEAKGNRIVNSTEAKICVQLVESLLTVGVPASSIGVMTHYRSQLALLKHGLRGHSDVEMHTADRFQGRDKEVVILSLVRSNEDKSIGELLKDWRRINVAFTRAKTKLLVIGSRETLKGKDSEEMVAKFVRLMEERDWIYDLPKGALDSHVFQDIAAQASAKDQPLGTQWKQVDGKKSERWPVSLGGKENIKPGPKRAKVGDRALLAGKPVLRDIMNDLFGA
jgi:DNA replication ATP-dependent helicase Dna2